MKQAPLFLMAILIACYVYSRPFSSLDREIITHPGFSDSASMSIPAMGELLTDIVNVTGIEPEFILKEANVLNLQASISRNKKIISYNPVFINSINSLAKDKWSACALLAHEVGHHLKGHTTGRKGSRSVFELEADEFAGFVLYKLGASLEQAQEVMFYIAKTEASKYYPNRDTRMLAIERGWNQAKK